MSTQNNNGNNSGNNSSYTQNCKNETNKTDDITHLNSEISKSKSEFTH